jgi:hypothetical protein
MKLELRAPASYFIASQELRNKYTGGCGAGKFGDWLVPDTMWGLCVTEACNIHDWMYAFGKNKKDRKEADDTLLENLYRTIDNDQPTRVFRILRRMRARTYYFFVRTFGRSAFHSRS